MNNRSLSTNRAGFTLMEVMVVLLIMSGILVSITQVLQAARQSRDLIHNIDETQSAGPAILDLIERDLRAISLFQRDPGELLFLKDRTESGLDADILHFVSNTNSMMLTDGEERYRRADVNEVGYVLRSNPDYPGEFLEIYRREGFGIDDQPFEGGQYAFLHDRIKGFEVQVFDEDGEDAEPLDNWGANEDEEQTGLPTRIEITLIVELAEQRAGTERLSVAEIDKYIIEYKRVLRFPEYQRASLDVRPLPLIPDIVPPNPDTAPGGGAGMANNFGGEQIIDAGSLGGLGNLGGGDTQTITATEGGSVINFGGGGGGGGGFGGLGGGN